MQDIIIDKFYNYITKTLTPTCLTLFGSSCREWACILYIYIYTLFDHPVYIRVYTHFLITLYIHLAITVQKHEKIQYFKQFKSPDVIT